MRSTSKCDIIILINIGFYFMKTKIIYISGNEIFDMADIRAAFEEVRNTLNLDKDTVLFGVPVDNDDAGLTTSEKTQHVQIEPDIVDKMPQVSEIPKPTETVVEIPEIDSEPEPIVDESVKKRGRTRKVKPEPEINEPDEQPKVLDENVEDKVVPILSVLSSKEDTDVIAEDTTETIIQAKISEINDDDLEIIEDIVQETENLPESDATEQNDDESENDEDSNEADLEKLLSAMKPVQEDILDSTKTPISQTSDTEDDEEENIDATLEQLATEFVQTQDKIASETKSSGRGKIGKLRNILPFKQSKHKDQGLGDLFGWAGVAANDEDFSVPGFFTNASQKK